MNGNKREIANFVVIYPNCQKLKVKNLILGDMIKKISIHTWKWEAVNMNFIIGLPRTRHQHDLILAVVYQMTKSAHSLPIKISNTIEDYAPMYIHEFVRLHGITLSMISDRGTRFT